jgi:hypothetical protein
MNASGQLGIELDVIRREPKDVPQRRRTGAGVIDGQKLRDPTAVHRFLNAMDRRR